MVEIAIVKRGKRCSMCGKPLTKGQRHLVYTKFSQDFPYPIKKNLCLECSSRIVEDDFIDGLGKVVSFLKEARMKLGIAQQPRKEEKEVPF